MFRRFGSLAASGAVVASPLVLCASVAYAEADKKPLFNGVYLWGDNSQGLISRTTDKAIREPQFVEYFKDQQLKDLALSPQVAVAVLKNGQTVQWTAPGEQAKVLDRENIEQVAVWDDLVVALSKSGSIFSWHAGSSSQHVSKFKVPSLGWFEKIVDFKIGRDHIAALTSKGRVLTGLTRELPHHQGQLGVAQLSAFDPAPDANELHQVKLLQDKKIKEIACGEEHVLFLDDRGDVYGCGNNLFGQLALPFNYNMPNYSVPTRTRAQNIASIAAGASVSYFTTTDKQVLVVGNGIHGHFGTGSFANMQDSPIHIPTLESLSEFDERLNKVVALSPLRWSVSNTHTFVELSNASRDWYVWGLGLSGQLGNGRLSRVVKPMHIRSSNWSEWVKGNTCVAGNGISAAYTSAK